jgi:hypothetical protein
MARASSIQPVVGDWYSSRGERFEVVAVDEDEGTIEVQFADGTLAEVEADDWSLRCQAGAMRTAEPPEDFSAGNDQDADDPARYSSASYDDEASLRAGPLEGLDLFE